MWAARTAQCANRHSPLTYICGRSCSTISALACSHAYVLPSPSFVAVPHMSTVSLPVMHVHRGGWLGDASALRAGLSTRGSRFGPGGSPPSDSPPLSSACTLQYPGPRITFPRMWIRVHAGVTRGEFLVRFRGMADSAEAARSWADIVEENVPTDNLSAHTEAGIIPATEVLTL